MFLSVEKSGAITLGSEDDHPRTIYPMIHNKDIDFGLEKIPAQSGIPVHVHEHRDEVITVIKGKGWGRIGSEEQFVECGDVMFVPRKTEHELRNVMEQEELWDLLELYTIRGRIRSNITKENVTNLQTGTDFESNDLLYSVFCGELSEINAFVHSICIVV